MNAANLKQMQHPRQFIRIFVKQKNIPAILDY